MFYRLDKNNNPVCCIEPSKPVVIARHVHKTPLEKFVNTISFGQFSIGETTRVSTIFLCLNQGDDDFNPILFETTIFGGEFDQCQERYHTWKEAIDGHNKWLSIVKKEVMPPLELVSKT